MKKNNSGMHPALSSWFRILYKYICLSISYIILVMITCVEFILILPYLLFLNLWDLFKRIKEWLQRKLKLQRAEGKRRRKKKKFTKTSHLTEGNSTVPLNSITARSSFHDDDNGIVCEANSTVQNSTTAHISFQDDNRIVRDANSTVPLNSTTARSSFHDDNGIVCEAKSTVQNSTTARISFQDDNGIACEILSRLPVKSLLRFKCVCKRWRFLIEEDSYFIDLHLNQSKKHPNLLVIVPLPYHPASLFAQKTRYRRRWNTRKTFLKVDLQIVGLMLEGKGKGRAPWIDTISEMEYPCENEGFFGPVNGLIGFFSNCSPGICICNVSTLQVSPWIESKSPKNVVVVEDKEKKPERTPYYELGFDPATKKHKVMRIWRVFDSINKSRYIYACDVLTVGDNIWRRTELPPVELDVEDYRRKHTVYLNGSIYYCTSTFMEAGKLGNGKIVSFDVGAEKFRVITIPSFILDQPRHVYRNGTSPNYLIELEGCLALVSKMSDSTATLWVFDDVHGNNNEKKTSTSSSSNRNWNEVTIELPYLWSADRDISFHSVAGTDLIVIESYDDHELTCHFYNWKTKSCKKIFISKDEYYPAISTVSTLVESLVHVQ